MADFIIYGANGYTGALIAREAVRSGLRPILAGRDAASIGAFAAELGLEARVFSLDEPNTVDEGLRGASAVLHCAGPFSRTARPMADACLRTRTHYLDITGEHAVFETLAARDAEAQAAHITLLPGVGLDVVPSDCLAAHLKRRLPTATHLALGFEGGRHMSRGTALTVLESLPRGGVVRKDGKLTPVPAAYKTRVIDFGNGPRKAITIPWGDVATAYHSTRIPNIEFYMAAPLGMRMAARVSRCFGWLLGSQRVQSWLARRIRAGAAGPTEEERKRSRTNFWGEVVDADGRTAVARLQTPDGYDLTVQSSLAIMRRVLDGAVQPGFHTAARAFGADFILTMAGVNRTDDEKPPTSLAHSGTSSRS